MATRIKLRRGSAAEWTSADPTLEAGEVGVETDTRKIKIGDGSTSWTSLPYAVDFSSYATETYVDNSISSLVDSAPEALNTLNELSSALNDDASFSTTVTNSLSLKAPLASPTFTGNLSADDVSISGTSNINEVLEYVDVAGFAPGGSVNIDVLDGSVKYFVIDSISNLSINFRGNSTTTFKDFMSNSGKSCSVAILLSNGSTAYYPTSFEIDGVSITPKWQGGSAPTSGNPNSIDLYTFTIIWYSTIAPDTPEYIVLASQTEFA